MRNLNGVEIAGRTLRVDNACTEKSRMEIQSQMAEPVTESPFGPACEPGRAPEAISKAVASLPPEQMFELMRQMKACIKNNPVEARTMLLQNPQLAYALLQAQVVMKIVDPKAAVELLHRVSTKVDAIRPMQNIAPQMGAAGGFQANLMPQIHPVSSNPAMPGGAPGPEPWRQNPPQDPRGRPMPMDFQAGPQGAMMGGPPPVGAPQVPMQMPPP